LLACNADKLTPLEMQKSRRIGVEGLFLNDVIALRDIFWHPSIPFLTFFTTKAFIVAKSMLGLTLALKREKKVE